jgi:hypothetical protein
LTILRKLVAKMKILLVIGDHLRHLYFAEEICSRYSDVGIILMGRESLEIPQAPICSAGDKILWDHHFRLRKDIEEARFPTSKSKLESMSNAVLRVDSSELNSSTSKSFATKFSADICLVFGSDLIRDPLLSALPQVTLNVHLGLSPRYRGSATLFWPFYFMEPHWCGVTIHQISSRIDGGQIVSQRTPNLVSGMKLHDVGAESVKCAVSETLAVLESFESKGALNSMPQTSSGKLFLMSDFKPHHLRINYIYFDDQMVDALLTGFLQSSLPTIISHQV